MQNLFKWFKNPFKKKEVKPKVTEEAKESFAKIILDKKNNKTPKKKKFVSKTSYEIGGITYKVGDKVICRSNEPHPLWVGKIVEFWDNEGKWETATPRVRNIRTGKIWGVNGVIKPYSEELMKTLRGLKPLEQWNSLVPEEARYTEDEIKRKEELFKKKERFMATKKVKGSLPK
jgi:hypothetical protein